MRILMMILFLAVGCDDADCPESITPGSSCSSAGLSCSLSMEVGCDCKNGKWQCYGGPPDLSMPLRD